jgi:hypothetical protein
VEAESLYKTNTVIKVKVPLSLCVSTGLSYTFILITTAHHDRSIRERVIVLAEKGGLPALLENSTVFPCLLQGNGYGNTRWIGKLEGTRELGYGAFPDQLRMH